MKSSHPLHACNCSCCAAANLPGNLGALNRRDFLFRVGTAAAGGLAFSALDVLGADPALALPARGPLPQQPLKVQPVLTYALPQRREHTSWRSWGGIQKEADVAAEKARITGELAKLKAKADFPVEILPLAAVINSNEAAAAAQGDYDAMLVYAAGGGRDILQRLISPQKFNLMFLRHESGPVYLWYEIAHPHFLRKAVDEFDQTGLDVADVVVDNCDELLWRCRALHGLKNTLGKRIVAIGGAGGWGAGGRKAPEIARNLWKLDIVDCSYKDLEPRLKAARQDPALVRRCDAAASRYLAQARVSLHTARPFVNRAFVLTEVMKDLMDEAHTDAITVHHCMGTIMGISETTACMPLSFLNDEGYLAFCESDFVVIPSGILLHYISGKPVFLNDPTFPHENVVTLAHCTAPRKMDGRRAERVKILTHFESDYGAAPKVEMKLGQVCTNLVPDFDCKKWVGFAGKIVGNPFLDICRSQIEVQVLGDGQALLQHMKGFHWMMSYGNYMRETGYALKKLNVDLRDVSAV
ncbi:MAG TPA: sugar isomerase [Candidatus Paceibacterota bacterium]|nr:sugar isomerase [Verrucomicrobiota bacterium]HSA12044.1 sugar isomerase [Candidatus Paceibacterota bacterium]